MPLYKNLAPPPSNSPIERFAFGAIESTNAFATEWIRLAKSPSEAVILADDQTMGRGQFGRPWSTEAGKDLAWTYARRFGMPVPWGAEDLVRLNMHWAASAAECILDWTRQRAEIGIKWPNDLYAKSPEFGWRKLGGMLIEAHWRGDGCLGVLFGVGINVQSVRHRGADRAISLLDLGCTNAEVKPLAHALERAVRSAWETPFDPVKYEAHLLFKGERRTFVLNEETRAGAFMEALPNGSARFLWDTGEQVHPQGEVGWCWDQG